MRFEKTLRIAQNDLILSTSIPPRCPSPTDSVSWLHHLTSMCSEATSALSMDVGSLSSKKSSVQARKPTHPMLLLPAPPPYSENAPPRLATALHFPLNSALPDPDLPKGPVVRSRDGEHEPFPLSPCSSKKQTRPAPEGNHAAWGPAAQIWSPKVLLPHQVVRDPISRRLPLPLSSVRGRRSGKRSACSCLADSSQLTPHHPFAHLHSPTDPFC